MKHLSDRYTKVLTYKGFDICVLKSACPSQGDGMGYRIDDARFDGVEYGHPDDAIDAINAMEKEGPWNHTGKGNTSPSGNARTCCTG